LSINWHLDAEPVPAILVLPPDAASLDEAHEAIELWEHYSGKVLDPTQRLVVEVMMAQTADGRWAAATTGREMPRQNGKGDEVEVVELWGLVQRSEAILHTVHDAVLLASQAQQRMLATLERPDLRRLVKRKWQGTGQQMIEMRNGGIIWYRTRTGGGGRGVDDIDRLVVDEAQHATEEHLSAVAPTLFANPNPQLNALGTAGLAGKSDWWWSVRKRALGSDPGAFGYVGHTAERVTIDSDGKVHQSLVDVRDRDVWRASNPALWSERGQGEQFLEEQLLRLGEASFAREHLGVWDPEPLSGSMVIPLDKWRDAGERQVEQGERVAYAIDASPDLRSAAIAASDGTTVKVLEHHPGVKWVVPALLGHRMSRPGPVLVDPRSPAGALLVDLEEAGVEVTTVAAQDHAQACGGLLKAVMDDELVHVGQAALNEAVSAAVRRPYGDAWAWDRRNTAQDISPLVAVTLARWGALTMPELVDVAANVW
jgi:hypothetical protein